MKKGSMTLCQRCGESMYSFPSRLRLYCSIACRTEAKRALLYDDAAGTKRCATCCMWRPFNDFSPIRGKKAAKAGALQAYCNSCASVTNRQWREVNRPPSAQIDNRPDLPTDKRLRKNALRREWARRNADTVRLWNKLRLHRQRGGGPTPSPAVVRAIGCMQDWKCTYCATSLVNYHLDHKTPLSRQGTNEESNLQLLCAPCNLKKHTMTHEEYAAIVGVIEPECAPVAPFDVGAFTALMEAGDTRGAIALMKAPAACTVTSDGFAC